MQSESPRKLKPDTFETTYGEAEAPPQSSSTLIPCWNWWALAPLAVVAAAAGVPFFLNHGFLAIGLVLERGFALVCHQRPERSFAVFGGSVAVCSRCLGIYLGAACGLLFWTSRWIALRLLIAVVALNVLDAASEVAGLHGNWLGVRLALGFALGASGALMILSSTQPATYHPS
jgi:uncharacterized membrane protein